MELRAATWSPNVGAVITALRGQEPLTLSELAAATSLSRPTVAEAASSLIGDGLVERMSPVRGNRAGRPAARYRFRAEGGAVVGVCVDDRVLELLVVGLDGTEFGSVQVPVAASGSAGRVAELIASITKATRRFAPGAPVVAIGVAAPGFADDRGFIRASPAIPDLDGVHLGDELREAFGCDILVGNDVQLAAIAEHRLGAADGTETYLYVWAGQRVSAALFVGGRLHAGSSGAAGIIGELDMVGWSTAPQELPSASLLREAEGGDLAAAETVARYADRLSRGASALALAIDPELVVIGCLDAPGAGLLPQLIADGIVRYAHVVNPPVVLSPLGPRARVLGALTVAMEQVEREFLALA